MDKIVGDIEIFPPFIWGFKLISKRLSVIALLSLPKKEGKKQSSAPARWRCRPLALSLTKIADNAYFELQLEPMAST